MEKMTESTLTKAILDHWAWKSSRPQYIVALQVNNGAGFNYSRRLDAVVFDTWPSTGLGIHGLEIKSTKAGLRNELRDTNKFSDFAAYLDTFSIVCPHGVGTKAMLPDKWGLYTSKDGKTLHTVRRPLMLHAEGKKPVNREFMASFVRALVDRSLSNESKRAEYSKGYDKAKQQYEWELKLAEEGKEKYAKVLKDFEKASGIVIDTWSNNGLKVGEAVKFVLEGGLSDKIRYAQDMKNLGNSLIKFADGLEKLKERVKFTRF